MKFRWAQASRVDSPDQAAHAGAGNVINRDAMLLEPLQNANVGQTQRTTTFK